MNNVTRYASESATDFERRVEAHVAVLANAPEQAALRDAAVVYAEGVVAGLSIALAAVQRRERVSDHLRRWESALLARIDREPSHAR